MSNPPPPAVAPVFPPGTFRRPQVWLIALAYLAGVGGLLAVGASLLFRPNFCMACFAGLTLPFYPAFQISMAVRKTRPDLAAGLWLAVLLYPLALPVLALLILSLVATRGGL